MVFFPPKVTPEHMYIWNEELFTQLFITFSEFIYSLRILFRNQKIVNDFPELLNVLYKL